MSIKTFIDAIGRHFEEAKQESLMKREHLEASIEDVDRELMAIQTGQAIFNYGVRSVVCPRCRGEGERMTSDAAGSRDYVKCEACKGSGLRKG